VGGQSRRANLHPVGAQPAALTAHEYLAPVPLSQEVPLVVEQVMLDEPGAKCHGALNIHEERHSLDLVRCRAITTMDMITIASIFVKPTIDELPAAVSAEAVPSLNARAICSWLPPFDEIFPNASRYTFKGDVRCAAMQVDSVWL
jgi:hypothetical protein